ncbi:MAG: flagellar motor switch protein FliG [Armatimonadetes bacterium]|nr:flagellar motor switch protein FliG [Armatimonadota bacterium]
MTAATGGQALKFQELKSSLTGKQKSAIVLVALGIENSLKVLTHLNADEVESLTMEIASLGEILPEVRESVLEEFLERSVIHAYISHGGISFAQEILERSLGPERAAEVITRMSSSMHFKASNVIQKADLQEVFEFLQHEHPQTIAFVLCSLPPEKSGPILSALAPEVQAEVAMRVAVMEKPSEEAIHQFDRIISTKLVSLGTAKIGGVKALVGVLKEAGRASEKIVVAEMEKERPEMAEEIKKLMFVFEDIVLLDNRAIQRVLREVDGRELAMSLKGVPQEVVDKIEQNLSERARTMLREDVEDLGAIPMRNVEKAQQKIVSVIRRLEESGDIVIGRGKGESMVV